MNDYRYQLERYRGRGNRYISSQCGRKYRFTLYIDTHNNNEYVNKRVGKCGYHYTPHQYFEDNPWLREVVCLFKTIGFLNKQTNKQPPRESPKV